MLVVFKILSALLFMLYTFISSQLILGEKKKINKNLLFLFLIFFIAYYFIIFHINEMLFSLALTFLSIIFIKMYFDKDMISITIFSLVINLIRVLVKASFLFVSNSYMSKIFLFTDYTFLKFIINLFSILISLILIFILKKFIVKFIEKSFKCNHFYIEILSFFIINFILAIFFRYPINDLNIYNLIDSILFLSNQFLLKRYGLSWNSLSLAVIIIILCPSLLSFFIVSTAFFLGFALFVISS